MFRSACKKFICLFICLLAGGCSAVPSAAPSVLLTPLEQAQLADPAAIDPADLEALEVFFARWSAYMASVGIEAQDESDVYSDLYAFSTTWQQALAADNMNGGCHVVLYLPATPGLLEVDAMDGRIRTASVSYDSEDSGVRANLAFTVACNAMIYSLVSADDMTSVASIYNECMIRLHASGAEMAGIVSLDGYTFSLALTAEDNNMNFAAMLEE
ncbi:MAG: hypothetical protein HDQ87_08650 [Clostridia bacterium]|nr:hypothetical protein [Clostridia bacterium]